MYPKLMVLGSADWSSPIVMRVFIVMVLLMLFVMFRALRSPRLYYPPPRPSASELARELKPVGHIRRKGFTLIKSSS